MKLFEWNSIPEAQRMEVRKKFGIKPSQPTKSSYANGVSSVEDDGIREGDLDPIKGFTVGQVLQSLIGELPKSEVTNVETKEKVKEEIGEEKSKVKKGRPKKK